MPVRLTARSRLTLLYTGLVLAAGVVLTALTYLLMRENLAHREIVLRSARSDDTGTPPPQLPGPSELSQQVRDETLAALLTQAGIALAVVSVLAGVLGWLVAGRVLQPIRAISATAQHLSAENLSERVPVHQPQDELFALAETVNRMLDRIQLGMAERDQALNSQRLFTANAAHELRTPLTTIRTAIDVTLDGEPTLAELLTMAEDVRVAADDSRRTLDGLLALARSQAGLTNPRPVDLADVADAVLTGVRDQACAKGLAVHQDLRTARVTGEPVLLERMTANLVSNAMRYNHPGGHITASTGTAAGVAFVHVLNTGRQVPADQVDRLLEPFVRGEGSRTSPDGGTGLGLSIVRAVVLAHRGDIVATAQPGGGLDITVRLPQLSPPARADLSEAAAARASSSPSTPPTPRVPVRSPRANACG